MFWSLADSVYIEGDGREANNLEPGAALGLVFSDKPVITYTSNPVSIRAVGSFFRVGWPLVTILHTYRGNFYEVQIFVIFATHDQNGKIRTSKYETVKI